MMLVLLASIVVAYPRYYQRPRVTHLSLVAKDPTTWNIVYGGKATISFIDGYRLSLMGWRLEPNTEYTLIYYGDKTHNDEWPYATCLFSAKSSSRGYIAMGGMFYYNAFFRNNVDEKIWLVLSNDVNCAQGKMTAWNPTEYLFEHNTI